MRPGARDTRGAFRCGPPRDQRMDGRETLLTPRAVDTCPCGDPVEARFRRHDENPHPVGKVWQMREANSGLSRPATAQPRGVDAPLARHFGRTTPDPPRPSSRQHIVGVRTPEGANRP